MPTTAEEEIYIDTNNGNNFWWETIDKDIPNVGIDFELLAETEKPPPGCNKLSGLLVFNVKMYLTRKLIWLLDGNKTPYTIGSTYSGVVSRESIEIDFTNAYFNGVNLFAADIHNT